MTKRLDYLLELGRIREHKSEPFTQDYKLFMLENSLQNSKIQQIALLVLNVPRHISYLILPESSSIDDDGAPWCYLRQMILPFIRTSNKTNSTLLDRRINPTVTRLDLAPSPNYSS